MYPRNPNRHFIVGVIILVVGVVLLLDQIGFVAANDIFKFWPLILIYFGATRLTRHPGSTGWFWGGFLILLGVSFQLQELGLSHVHVVVIWPVFLICAGILLILQRYESRNRWENPPFPGPPPGIPPEPPPVPPPTPEAMPGPTSAPSAPPATGSAPGATSEPGNIPRWGAPSQTRSNFAPDCGPSPPWNGKSWEHFHQRMEDFSDRFSRRWEGPHGRSDTSAPRLNEVNIFWGTKRRIIAKNFIGGEIVAIFGGFEIDLREADMIGDVAEIEIATIFGGGDIRVPPNWEIVMDTVGIFGSCDDRTRHPAMPIPGASPAGGTTTPQTKRLIIKGVAIFGGLAVKN